MTRRFLFAFFGLVGCGGPAARAQAPLLRGLTLTLDTARYATPRQVLTVAGEPRLYFYYHRDDETAELTATPVAPASGRPLRLRPSPEFQLVDSLAPTGPGGTYRATLRFRNLTAAPFVTLTFAQAADSAGRPPRVQAVSLLPLTRTAVGLRVADPELFVGEEKMFDLDADNPANVRADGTWTRGQDLDYKLTRELGGSLRLHVLPNALGARTLVLRLAAERPRLDPATGRLSYQLPPLRQDFVVRASRLRFVVADRKDVTLDAAGRQQGVELILDNGHAFELHRTYRLEAQQEPGGALVAELFTRSYLANDRVLCQLRVYNPHRRTDGYLYVKDQDEARFIANFDIAPRARVAALSVLHRGGDWTSTATVSPGETADVRLEGEGLLRGRFHFEGLTVVPSDSSARSETAVIYRVQVPLGVVRRKLGVFDGTTPTGLALTVKEVQRPHPLGFVSVNYGAGPVPVTRLAGPVLCSRNIPDVVLSFNAAALDDKTALYGRQYLSLEVRMLDAAGNLVDQRTLDNVVVCPTDPSPRAPYYQDGQCQAGSLSLNALLGHKTYDLDDWGRVELTLKHVPSQYTTPGYTQRVELVRQRRTTFDIDVSFPAGLLTRRQGEAGYGDFGGISLATLAQLRFYSPGRINHLRPYRVGAGFVALNAFNLGQSTDRDLGLVLLGSVLPGRPDAKLTFPLYLGGGYLLSAGKWFYLLGPGIGVKL